VKWVAFDGADEVLQPEIILGFHGLCLVKPVHDEDWYMGSLYDRSRVQIPPPLQGSTSSGQWVS
jgi:hypothetical protein